VGKHPFPAEAASATGCDTGNEDPVAFVKAEDIRSQFLDNPDPFMAQNPAVSHSREVTFQNVKVSPADGGRSDPNDGIRSLYNRRPGLIFPGPSPRLMVNQGFHTIFIVTVFRRYFHGFSNKFVLDGISDNLRVG
jgi:hypothetical protein